MRRQGAAALTLVFSSFAAQSFAADDPHRFCFPACQNAVAAVRFEARENITDPTLKQCVGYLRLQSLYLCADTRCGRQRRDAGLSSLNETCTGLGVPIPGFEIVEEYGREDVEKLEKFNATSPGKDVALTQPALPTKAFLDLWMGTLEASDYVRRHHSSYGWLMGYYWAAVVAVGMLMRSMSYLETRRKHLSSRDSKAWTWFRANLATPATLGRRCAQDYGSWATVPPLVQSITIGLFAALNVYCSLFGYRLLPGNIYYPEISKQILRHVSDRTGIISFANFPLIWLFGMRNNVVLWVTCWDFGTFNNFHRWIARIATLQAVIHSIGYTWLILEQGGWSYFAWWWTLLFWWAGELATIFMCAVLGFSFYWFRRSQYELFLFVHIGLSLLVLVTMLGHVSIFNGEYDALVWVPVITWAADRVIRAARVVAFNWKFWTVHGQATFDPASNMVRLEVPTASSMYRVRPGTFFYLMTLDDTAFWESHPFTVASVSTSGRDQDYLGEASPLLEASDASDVRPKRMTMSESMTILIRPYNSFTSRLRDRAEAHWPKPAHVRMAVDGPYGRTLALDLFSRVVFVVGGSGIVVALSYIRVLLDSSRCQNIDIHWSVREPALAREISQRDLRGALGHEKVSLNIYMTGADDRAESEASADVVWHWQRMNPTALIEATTTPGASSSQPSLAIVACGPAKMADETRCASVAAMRRAESGTRVEYFEESFQW